MEYKDFLKIAVTQSAIELNCDPDDFFSGKNTVVRSCADPMARKYLELPFACNFVSYGENIVASANDDLYQIAHEYMSDKEWYRCFETPNVTELNERVSGLGYKVMFMADYFIADPESIPTFTTDYDIRHLTQSDFGDLYLPQFSNALSSKRPYLDIMGVGAYDDGKLIGLSGCSADCDSMYQIGIDVLVQYRRKGIASLLTSELAKRIIDLEKVPFYCAAWSNILSVRNAIKCGFKPTWIELTVVKDRKS